MLRILVILFLLGAIANPSVRAAVWPVVQPYVQRGLDPVYEWSARSRVGEISRNLQAALMQGGSVPTRDDFARYLRSQFAGPDPALDPWDTLYYLQEERAGVRVGSAGRDRVPHTADDILSPLVTVTRR